MIVDFHAHLWGSGFIPPAFFEEDARVWAEKAPDRKPEMIMPKLLEGNTDNDGKLFIENMDRAGVDVTVVNMTDFGLHWSGQEPTVSLERQIEFYAGLIQRYPDRLKFFSFIDPRRKNAAELFERAVKESGCAGCGEMTPHGFSVTDEIVQPIFRKCQELGVPVFIHTRTGHGTEIEGRLLTRENAAHPFHLKSLQAAYPDMLLIFGHAGYDYWWEEACRIARGNPNSYLELSDWAFALSNPGDMVAKIACMRDMVGADHILFGSDQPSGVRFCGERSFLPAWKGFINNLPQEAAKYGYHFTREETELIMGENARRILNF